MQSDVRPLDSDSASTSSKEKPKGMVSADANLGQLREQIKKVMIPLLIRIFELKLAAQQAKSPSSRLNKPSQETSKEIREQLLNLEEDIKLLHLWCQSCQKQIEKAISETDKPGESSLKNAASTETSSHPAIEKSFSEAVSKQTAFFKSQQGPSKLKAEKLPFNTQIGQPKEDSKSSWWRKLLDPR